MTRILPSLRSEGAGHHHRLMREAAEFLKSANVQECLAKHPEFQADINTPINQLNYHPVCEAAIKYTENPQNYKASRDQLKEFKRKLDNASSAAMDACDLEAMFTGGMPLMCDIASKAATFIHAANALETLEKNQGMEYPRDNMPEKRSPGGIYLP